MPLPDLTTMIRGRVPFLTELDADTNKIVSKKIETFYFLQSGLMKSDELVEDETAYTAMEKLLIADLVAYELIKDKVIDKSIGTDSNGGKTIKRAKADVVETEFMFPDKGTATFFNAADLMAQLKNSICQKATILRVYIPICSCDVEATPMPFIYVEDSCKPKSIW